MQEPGDFALEQSMFVNGMNMTSLQVFEAFIKRSISQKLIEEDIVSFHCFKAWLQSRRRLVKHPKASYRRVVLAHLRGSDGRVSFDADVEASVLRKLRHSLSKGLDPFVFQEENIPNKYHPSWRNGLLRRYGYHEKQALCHVAKPKPNLEVIAEWIRVPKDELAIKARNAAAKDINLLSPALCYLLSTIASSDPRCDTDFVLPKPSERFFQPGMPVTSQTTNHKTWTTEWVGEVGLKAYGDYTGTHISHGFASVLEFLNTIRLVAPLRSYDKPVWFRFRVAMPKKPVIVLMRTIQISDTLSSTCWQILAAKSYPEKPELPAFLW